MARGIAGDAGTVDSAADHRVTVTHHARMRVPRVDGKAPLGRSGRGWPDPLDQAPAISMYRRSLATLIAAVPFAAGAGRNLSDAAGRPPALGRPGAGAAFWGARTRQAASAATTATAAYWRRISAPRSGCSSPPIIREAVGSVLHVAGSPSGDPDGHQWRSRTPAGDAGGPRQHVLRRSDVCACR